MKGNARERKASENASLLKKIFSCQSAVYDGRELLPPLNYRDYFGINIQSRNLHRALSNLLKP